MFWLVFIPGVLMYISPIVTLGYIATANPLFARTWNKKSYAFLVMSLAVQFAGLYLCILARNFVA